MENLIIEHIEVAKKLIDNLPIINLIADEIKFAYQTGRKVIIFGNGGSAVDSEHFVTELVSKFKLNRKGLPALSLSSNIATITAIGNDFDYKEIYSRQIKAYADLGDIVIGLSTSGTSPNVVEGLETAHKIGALPILITGNNVMLKHGITLNIDSSNTARIQEIYMLALHMICEKVEQELFNKVG